MIDVNVNRDDCTVYHFSSLFDFAFNIKQLNISIFVSVLTVVFDVFFFRFMSCYRLEQLKEIAITKMELLTHESDISHHRTPTSLSNKVIGVLKLR